MLKQLRFRVGSWAAVFALPALLFVHGCTQIPQKEFGGHQQAFNETQQVAKEVLGDFPNTRDALLDVEAKKKADAAAEDRNAACAKEPYPPRFAAPVAATANVEQDEIAARLRVLEMAARYNEVLLALARGKSVDHFGTLVHRPDVSKRIRAAVAARSGVGGFFPVSPRASVLSVVPNSSCERNWQKKRPRRVARFSRSALA